MVYKPNLPLGDVLFEKAETPMIEIKIVGNSHCSGKTTLAVVIENALRAAGMTNVKVNCRSGDFNDIKSVAFNIINGTIVSDDVRSIPVTIHDVDGIDS